MVLSIFAGSAVGAVLVSWGGLPLPLAVKRYLLPLALPMPYSLVGRFQTVEGLTPGRQHGTVAIGVRELS